MTLPEKGGTQSYTRPPEQVTLPEPGGTQAHTRPTILHIPHAVLRIYNIHVHVLSDVTKNGLANMNTTTVFLDTPVLITISLTFQL